MTANINGWGKTIVAAVLSGALFFFIGKAEQAGSVMEKVASHDTTIRDLTMESVLAKVERTRLSEQVKSLTEAVRELTGELKERRKK